MSIKKIHINSTFIKATTFSSGFSNLSVGSITDGSNNVLVILREREEGRVLYKLLSLLIHYIYYSHYLLLTPEVVNTSDMQSTCFVYTLHMQQRKFVSTHQRALLVSLKHIK